MPVNVTPGVLTAAVGALLTFLAAFLTWATVEVTSRVGTLLGGGTRSTSGLEGDRLGKATLVLALAAVALCVLLLQPSSRSWGWIALAAVGGLIVVLALIDLAAISDVSDLRERLGQVQGCSAAVQCTGSRTPGIGVYLTIVGGLVVLIGALLHHGVFATLQTRIRAQQQTRRTRAEAKAASTKAASTEAASTEAAPTEAASGESAPAESAPAESAPAEPPAGAPTGTGAGAGDPAKTESAET
jgi:hypothetical protein